MALQLRTFESTERQITHMQKLINDPLRSVADYLRGFGLAHADSVRVHEYPSFVTRIDAPVRGKVTIISGSGSGHEPLNAGYVGYGMLDAACPGDIFTSPTPDQYLAAIRAAHAGNGVVLIVKNYTGGVLNTQLVMEIVEEDDVEIASILVNDDVAIPDAGRRRGMGATVLVEKIVGAAAEARYSLPAIVEVGQRATLQARSMGVALSSCTSPAVGRPTFRLPMGQMEVGVGIHGEAGRWRAPLIGADAVVDLLIEPIVIGLDLRPGDRVLAMVNGLGGTPQQELYIVYGHLHQALEAFGVRLERRLVGNFITSLDMAGCSITLLRLDDELLRLWDAPVHTPTFRW